ncbi:MAG: DUF6531 domain-containing protein, partial [Planctomycetota bacterium]
MNIIQKNLKPLTILILFFFLFQQSGPPDVLAHCPHHSGQNLGSGQTGSPPEDEDDPGEPDTKPEGDETGNEPDDEDECDDQDDPEVPSDDGSEGDPIYLFDGKFFYYHTDLRIPGRIPLKIGRSYDSFCLYNG